MEEIKKMEETKKVPTELTYEQLKNAASQLQEQNKQLYSKLQEINMSNVFARLNFLFRVVEQKQAFDEQFVKSCVKEIEDLITIPEDKIEEDKVKEEA